MRRGQWLRIVSLLIVLSMWLGDALRCNAVTEEQASSRPSTAMLNREVALSFAPETAFFVVQFDSGAPVRVPAVLVPPFVNPSMAVAGDAEPKWLVGGEVAIPAGAREMRSFGVALGRDKEAAALELVSQEIEHLPFSGDSEGQLRAHLMERKGVVSSLKLQMAEQESTLRRLREDAEVVGNFARVVDAREELAKVEASIRSVDKDIANLERFLGLAGAYPAPKNYRNREQQLASQLIELTEAARKAEQGEFLRRQSAQGDMQNRLRLLEAARTSDVSGLGEQLSILRTERERLERGAPSSSVPLQPKESPATADDL